MADSRDAGGPPDERLQLRMPRWVQPLWVAAVAIPAVVACLIYFGPVIGAIVATATALALVGWWSTTYHRPASRRIIPWYVVAVVALLVQAWEQWSAGYAAALVGLFPDAFAAPVGFHEGLWLQAFPLASTVVFLLGGVAVFFHHPVGGYLAWLVFTLAGVLAVSQPVMLLAAGEVRYIPGAYTALPLLAVAGIGLVRLVTDPAEVTGR